MKVIRPSKTEKLKQPVQEKDRSLELISGYQKKVSKEKSSTSLSGTGLSFLASVAIKDSFGQSNDIGIKKKENTVNLSPLLIASPLERKLLKKDLFKELDCVELQQDISGNNKKGEFILKKGEIGAIVDVSTFKGSTIYTVEFVKKKQVVQVYENQLKNADGFDW